MRYLSRIGHTNLVSVPNDGRKPSLSSALTVGGNFAEVQCQESKFPTQIDHRTIPTVETLHLLQSKAQESSP